MLLEMMMPLEMMVRILLILGRVGKADVPVLLAASNCSLIFLDQWRFLTSLISGKMTSAVVMSSMELLAASLCHDQTGS